MKKSHPRKHHSQCCHCKCPKRRCAAPCHQKSNISAERLTLLPGFLAKEVKTSDTTSATPQEKDDCSVKGVQVRRSWRLCKKSEEDFAGFFHKFEDKGKSVFKEIKQKLREDEEVFDETFLDKLHNFQLRETNYYKKKVSEDLEIANISVLESRKMSLNRKRALNEDDKENHPKKFPYIPPSNWVFQTPPNRKVNFDKLKADTSMRPAVLQKAQDKKVLYEMNSKINVDLSCYAVNKQIDIDKRYMVEVADVSASNFPGIEQEDEKMDFVPNDNNELESHFLALTSRPKKALPALPRFNTIKRKRDIFEAQPGCSTDEDYKPVCFLENLNLNSLEESFTFKFSNDDEGSTTGHLFDCDGNRKNTFNFRF